jgi:hypothetical protein
MSTFSCTVLSHSYLWLILLTSMGAPKRLSAQSTDHAIPGRSPKVDTHNMRPKSASEIPAPLPCVRCHEEAVRSTRLPMIHPTNCTPCHVFDQGGAPPTNEAPSWRSTHFRGDQSDDTKRALHPRSRARGRVNINHRAHLSIDVQCTDCHQPDGLEGATCQSCHARSGGPMACGGCHEELSFGRLRVRWPSAESAPLIPLSVHGGAIHDGQFSKNHSVPALASPQTCLQCHTQNSCDGCHSSGMSDGVKGVSIHPPQFLQLHGTTLRGEGSTATCTSCHEPSRSCAACHQRSGVHADAGPLSFGRRAPQRARFHPSGYSEGAHAREASRDLAQCVSCHTQRECVRCHGALAPTPDLLRGRARVNPHRYRAPCALPERASGQSCQLCHDQTHAQLCGR